MFFALARGVNGINFLNRNILSWRFIFALCIYAAMVSSANGLEVYSSRNPEDLYGTGVPDRQQPQDSVNLTLLPGETVRIYFVVIADHETTLKTSVCNVGAEESLNNISHDIELFHIKYWYQTHNSQKHIAQAKNHSDPILIPSLLLRNDSLIEVHDVRKQVSLKTKKGNRVIPIPGTSTRTAKRHQSFRREELVNDDRSTLQDVTLRPFKPHALMAKLTVPNTGLINGGRYTLTFRTDSNETFDIELAVNISSPALLPAVHEHIVYYRGRLHEGSVGSIPSIHKTLEQLLNDLTTIRSGGLSNVIIYQPIDDRILFEQYIAALRETGFTSKRLYLVDPKGLRLFEGAQLGLLRDRLLAVREIASRYGYESIYIYSKDEPSRDEIRTLRPYHQFLKAMGFHVFIAGSLKSLADVDDAVRLLNSPKKPDAALAEAWRGDGREIFSYDNPQAGVRNPNLYRQNYGLLLWAYGYTGAMIYAYQDGFGDIWNDFDHPRFRDHVFVYPTRSKGIPTLSWEAVGDAILDLRLVTTLERTIASIGIMQVDECPAMQFALAYLESLRASLRHVTKGPRTGTLLFNPVTTREQLKLHLNSISSSCEV